MQMTEQTPLHPVNQCYEILGELLMQNQEKNAAIRRLFWYQVPFV